MKKRTRSKQERKHRRLAAVLAAALLAAATCQASEWQVPLEITNGAAQIDTIRFGIHPDATPGLDPELGEVGLPPWPPSALFECRFMVAGTEGAKLDLRDSTWTPRTHDIRWQAGDGGYPIVIRWNRGALPYAALYISDAFGGIFIPPLNMYEADSLLIPPSWSFITRLKLEVTPGLSPGAEPVIDPIPDQQVFLGQQFHEIALDDYVFDPDTPDSLLQWFVTDNQALIFLIDENRILEIQAPEGWSGAETVTFTVRDPQHHTDHTQVTFTVAEGGLPQWTVPLTVTNAAQDDGTVRFGIHPDGTGGLDPELGEVALPPWPPSDAFDTRLLLPDGVTYSARDIRASTSDPFVIQLRWQPGDGGYPITIAWPGQLPLGEFTMRDELGGAYIPPFSMSDTTSLLIPAEWDFIRGVDINVIAVVDTLPPIGPDHLEGDGAWPDHWMRLLWTPCEESHFGYYELFFDTLPFAGTDAAYQWDWTDDELLTSIETVRTTIPLPESADYYYARIRAWDLFGNVGELSPLAEIPTGYLSGTEGDRATDAGGRLALEIRPSISLADEVQIRWRISGMPDISPGPARLRICDAAGRRIVSWLSAETAPRATGAWVWAGTDERGRPVPAGRYYIRLAAGRQTRTGTVILIR